jgi:phosphate-selective porin O/P
MMNLPSFLSFRRLLGKTVLSITLLLAMLLAPAYGQNVSFSGWGAAGAQFFDKVPLLEYNQEYYYRAKLQANIEYKEDIEAQIDIRAHSYDDELDFREYSVKFKPSKFLRLKIGNTKKPFGLEALETRDNYIAIDYSQVNDKLSEYGYAGRAIGMLAYYKYSKKRPEFPFSYYAGLYRNNSFTSFALLRGSYHVAGMQYSLGYSFHSRGGDVPFQGHAFSADIGYVSGDFKTSIEGFYARDPNVTTIVDDSSQYALGLKALSSMEFSIDGDFIEDIEPYILLTYFSPNSEELKYNIAVLQFGANFYIEKDIYIRLRADGLFTKEAYAEEYASYGSSFTLEIFTRFN